MAHYKFFTAKQNEDPFEVYLTHLKELVKPCNFGTMETKLLKTQIVLGIQSRDTLERLLREVMTIEKVIAYCQSVEAAEKNCKELEKTTEVNQIKRTKTTTNNCIRCGTTHSINICSAYSKTYNKCKLSNHFTSMCKTKVDFAPKTNKVKKKFNNKINKKSSYKQNIINTVKNESDSDNDENYTIAINQIINYKIKEKKWFQTILVNGIEITFQLDSGAETNILPLKIYKKLKNKEEIKKLKFK